MKSYVSTQMNPVHRLAEFRDLYQGQTRGISQSVSNVFDEARHFEQSIAEARGGPVDGLRMLEIGPGQRATILAYFSARNHATGIDFDFIPRRLGPSTFLRLLKTNGPMRTAKTVGRMALGIDRKFRAEVLRQLGLRKMPESTLLQMDAGKLTFPDECFDVVYSRAVFEHLNDPEAAIAEVRRVLKPGGVMFIRLHLYTSDSGIHDTRILFNRRGDLPYWAHLRPQHKHLVRPNSYLNEIRLERWIELFQTGMPGCNVSALRDAPENEVRELKRLRAGSELRDFSDEELLSPTVDVIWRKPAQG